VAFRRVFPGRVAVAVIERTPIGIGRLGDTLFLVDRHGSLIDEYGPNYSELDLPILNGLDGGAPTEVPRVDDIRAALAVKVVDAVSTRRDLAARVSEIDVTDARNAVLTLKDDPTLVRLGDEQFVHRLQTYLDLAPTLRERVPGADYADVRFDNRVYVRPAGVAATTPGIRAVSARTATPQAAPLVSPAAAGPTAPKSQVAASANTKKTTPARKAGPGKPRKNKGRRR
jgi:cell division septal protein FtsQ